MNAPGSPPAARSERSSVLRHRDAMPADPYIAIWEFEVPDESVDAFVEAYGPAGAWARLFRQASGYRGTELYRDRDDPQRFVTLDFWLSAEDYHAFQARFKEEYAALDRACEPLARAERPLGRFALADRSSPGF
jgi:heme-degrading monooxygenase HmoA